MIVKRAMVLILLLTLTLAVTYPVQAQGGTYYVSNTGHDDNNNGLSPGTAFATIGKVNSLHLQPGDKVLFTCGHTWRGEMLVIRHSGTAGDPLTFGSYPETCSNKPILSGAQPIGGWTNHSGHIYVADLSAGANAGKFGYGINQLFRGDQRLPMGRWPNFDAYDAGYSTIDGQPAGNRITDNQLPAVNWTGAVAHIKGMRWYILNRQVTGDSGSTLTLGANADCWGGSCTGWGFFLNNHLSTLDRDGEWHYDAATNRVYLYSTAGAPTDNEIEASVILKNDNRSWGGVTLGEDLNEPGISYVTVSNLDLRRWFRHGIATPTNHAHYENHHLTLQDNTISNVDGIGINLGAWVWGASDGRPDGWRGGYNLTVSGNTIDTANSMGLNTYSRNSTFASNVIRNVGLIENLGGAGMGCDFDAGGGHCTEDGDGFRIKVDKADDTGNYNTLTGNRLERIAYNGIDVFGYQNSFARNVIEQPCYAKGDCGGVRTFGSNNLSDTPVHDLTFQENLIIDTTGNTDGCHSTYKGLFGFGFYIDNGSRDVTLTGNTVISSTVHGILYQRSTGSITNNTLYHNSRTWPSAGAQLYVGSSPAYVSTHTGNVLYGRNQEARTLAVNELSRLGTSNNNYFFHPYRANHISAAGDRSLSSWQSYSSKDGSSNEAWFSLASGDAPLSRIFYNDTSNPKMFDLGDRQYLDLDQNQVVGSLTLPPFSSQILIDNGPASLTLSSISPGYWGADEAADFVLTVTGVKFTLNSVIRWNGLDQNPTHFVNSSVLTTSITADKVSSVGEVTVTVYDPEPVPTGTETAALTFRVVESVSQLYLPVVLK